MENGTRIELTDTTVDVIAKLSEGNPGAMTAMMDLMSICEEIDPQSFMGQLAPLLSFDTHGIYGSAIYIVYNDKCNRDPRKVLVLLRAVQLGIMKESTLVDMANDQMGFINLTEEEFKDIDAAVCLRLDDFKRA